MSILDPHRIPLISAQDNRDETTTFDARLVNAYVEKDSTDEMWVVKRPSLDIVSTVAAATARGVYNWRGNLYSIFGATLYKDGIAVSGTVDTTAGIYHFSACLGATPKLFFHNGVKGYTYDSGAGLVNITDVDYPASLVKGSAYLDGTTYVMDLEGNVFGSALNDQQSWNALNLIKAQIEPDRGVFIAKQLVYVIAFKEWSTEVFYDAGAAVGSPLAVAQNAKISYGCKTAASVQDMDGVLFWVAATRSGSFSVHKMENLKSQQISTPAIDRLLQGADYTTVYSWNAIRNGHRFYGITFKNSNLTLVYDDTTNLWAQWSSSTGGSYLAVVASTISPTNQVSLLQDEADGNIYKLNSTKYDYEGAAIPVDIYTPNFDGKQSKGKTVNKLYLLADQTPGSVVQVRYSDDDYRTWSNFIEVDLSQVSPLIENMGTFVKRAHHIRHTCNTPLRIKALEAHMLLGVL